VARPDNPRFHGFLIVDKPAGITSHDVVNRVRRLTGQRTVGHAGTLDPAATGVLPVALGIATKALAYGLDSSKTYRAEVTFGVETDSFDADGTVAATSAQIPSLTDITEAVPSFLGTTEQVPPMHSAVQVGGRRLYEMARSGIDFNPPARAVDIHQIEILSYRPPVLTMCVDCGAGTYIRSLARDLGRLVGSVAHLSDLLRIRSGVFGLEDAWTFDQLAELPLADTWPVIAYHPDAVLRHLPVAILDDAGQQRWQRGQSIPVPYRRGQMGFLRSYSVTGAWLGIGEMMAIDGVLTIHPRRVVTPMEEPDRWGSKE